MRMAEDLVKIRTKIFWGGKILGDHLVFRWNGRGLNHCQQSVGLFRLTSFSNSRKRRHQKSVQELHFTL